MGKNTSDPSDKNSNEHKSLSQATKSLECVWDLERIWSLLLCLGVKYRDLVLNVLAENLDALKCGGWGYLLPQPPKWPLGGAAVDGRIGQSGAPADTVWCANHVTQPLGFDHWSSNMWGHRTVRWCIGQVLFTVRCAFWHLLWLCVNCSVVSRLLNSTVALVVVAPLGTPDSLVNYSGVAP
jgi:hypothetical protein